MHHFSLSFLTETAEDMALSSRFHVAHKKIPSKDGDIMVSWDRTSISTAPIAFSEIPPSQW